MKARGFTPEQQAAVLLRDGGACVLGAPGCAHVATSPHHRLNRGMGGAPARNGLSNAAAICHVCNDGMESDAQTAALALQRGVKLRNGDDPARVPMWSPFFRQWTQPLDDRLELLGDDGGRLDAREVR